MTEAIYLEVTEKDRIFGKGWTPGFRFRNVEIFRVSLAQDILHGSTLLTDFLGMFLHRVVILFDGIPFVNRNNDTFSPVMCNSGNLGILLGYSFGGINNDDHHIRAFHSGNCTDNTVALNLLFDLVFAAKPRRINKYIFFSW